MPLGDGRVLLEPAVIARLVQLTAIIAGERALVVAAGTGYGAALLAACGARVTALEEVASLQAVARGILAELAPSVSLVTGPLAAGWPPGAPYDVILIEGAVRDIPPAIGEQLHQETGRLVAVLTGGAGLCQAVLAEATAVGLRAAARCSTAPPRRSPACCHRPVSYSEHHAVSSWRLVTRCGTCTLCRAAEERTWSYGTAGCLVSAWPSRPRRHSARRRRARKRLPSRRLRHGPPSPSLLPRQRRGQSRRWPPRRRRSLARRTRWPRRWPPPIPRQPALLAERAKLRATDENVPQALSGWRPTVVMAGNGGYGDGMTPASFPVRQHANTQTDRLIGTAQATLTQPLYTGGKTQASVNRAKNQVMAERANSDHRRSRPASSTP